MYTSIPTSGGYLQQAILWFLTQDHKPPKEVELIMTGLDIVLTRNHFTFGDSMWQQRNGIAMGTPVAPILATLYLGYYEEEIILPRFQPNLYLYKRYLDDIIIIWSDIPEKPYAWNELLAYLRRVPGLSWTYKIHEDTINFLDLDIFPYEGIYATRTFQKPLNLYLYPPWSSAHSPATKLGFIYGLILKYKRQNTRQEDFIHVCKLTFDRLLARGYPRDTLRKIFSRALTKVAYLSTTDLNNTRKYARKTRDHYYRIPYDPNGPSKSILRSFLGLDNLSKELTTTGYGKVTICYLKPKNLGQLIAPTRLLPTYEQVQVENS
jgi:hypothetical protein